MKIACVVGSYPKPSERFVVREVELLREMGVEVTVYGVDRAGAASRGAQCPARRESSPEANTNARRTAGAAPACLFCALSGLIALLCRPRTWRAIARFPFARLALLSPTGWREFVGGLPMASALADAMRSQGIEHIHACFATKPAAVGMMAAAMLRLPFTFAAHARDVFTDGVALKQKVAAARRVVLCNKAALKRLDSKIPDAFFDRLTLIRHGLDPAGFEFASAWETHEPVRVFAAGRLIEKKGFRYLVEAMARLPGQRGSSPKANSDAHRVAGATCEIAGAGPLERALRSQIERLGLGDRVALLGWLEPDALRAKMAEADVLVAPYTVARNGDRDGVPNVLLEAAAMGLPIVACNAGGIGEFVGNCETGRLVPPNDADLLAGAIESTLATPDTTRQFAAAARKKVENEYDLRENVKQLLAVFAGGGEAR